MIDLKSALSNIEQIFKKKEEGKFYLNIRRITKIKHLKIKNKTS
jgi:hypothetical protein